MNSANVVNIGTEELRAGLADGSLVVVDVREAHETAGGVIPGSILAPLSTFDPADLPEFGPRRIVFSCAAGVRSRIAAEASQRSGFAYDAHYGGGYKGWIAAGGPVERPPE